jgi:hypothetical protein
MQFVAHLRQTVLGCLAYVFVWYLSSELACLAGIFVDCHRDYAGLWILALILVVVAIATELVALPFVILLRRAALTRLWFIVLVYGLAGIIVPTAWFMLTSQSYLPPGLMSLPSFLAGAAMGAASYHRAHAP